MSDPAGPVPDRPRRYVALTGKIPPRGRVRDEFADPDGTVNPAHGRAKEARDLDEPDKASHPAGEHALASEVSERIRGVISSAEAAASAVRHEAEQRAQVRRRAADEEAARIVADAQRDAEALVTERIRRINELSDGIVERGEKIVIQLDRAEEVRAQLQTLADSLGQTAEELARDLGTEAPARPAAVSEPAATTEPADPALAERLVAEAAAAAEAEAPVETEVESEAEPAVEEARAEPAEAEEAPAEVEEAEPEEDASEVVDIVEQRRETVRREEAEPEAEDRREPDEQLSARLVALQMAVAGGNRGEVAEHLQRTFDVVDLPVILDDVFGTGTDAEKRVVWPRTADA